MSLYNLFHIAIVALLRNKTRALLTMLGVVIGISSVIAMLSLGQSSSENIRNEVSGMGTNLIMVMRQWRRAGVNTGNSNVETLVYEDCEAIRRQAQYVDYVSPYVSSGGQLVRGNNNWPSTVNGVEACYLDIRKYKLSSGTFFTDEQVERYAKVCIIGQTVVENLFPNGENPVGQEIRFNKTPFKVIGVLEEKGENQMGQDQDDIVIAPFTTIQKRILAIDYVHMIYASAKSEEVANLATDEIEDILRLQHRIQPGQENDFDVRTQSEMLDMMTSITGFLTVLLAAIASISLVVGGIGIMNIMYVTVTERTKEIGLRMAIGARGRDIMMQFLAESTILSLIGGVIGVLFGILLSYIVTAVINWPFVISTTAVAVSFFVCAATGIFFGWYPAKKAANLDPINALRYE
ncbi:MAG: ABC transporter permease [Paludibacteraceae bacterium]|nr:ABC transporter permease [Paludibacteraceae bacterium]